MTPNLTAVLGFYAAALLAVGWLTLRNAQRLRTQDIVTQERVTRPALDAWGAELMVRLDARFDAMEAAQSRREQERMAYLLKNAEELGGVRSTNQLLTGQLATLAAKLDRQIELSRLPLHNPRPRLRMNTADLPLTPATDAAALARLRALPPAEADALIDTLDSLPTPTARQDHLIGAHRLAPSLSALADWTHEARAARAERRFADFLADIRRAAERAEAFRDLLSRAETLHQVNIALLAARLFDALVARDGAAIETFARTFAEVIGHQSCLS